VDGFDYAVSALPATQTVPLATLPPRVRRTRWGKTPTTFGPLGRVLLTLALLVPLPLMIIGGLADPFVWGGAGFWLVVVMPLSLRDIWKAGLLQVR
jgi:hypothetical protein